MYSNNISTYYLFIGIVFIASPFLALLIVIIIALSERNKQKLFLFFVFLSLYLGCVNATKLPEGDQASYMLGYNTLSEYSLLELLKGQNSFLGIFARSHEYGWIFINYIGYYLTLGYYPAFVVLLTFIIYMLLFSAMYRFYGYIRIENSELSIIAGALCLGFFPQFFTQSMHLERQCVGIAILTFALVDYIVRGKPRLWLVLLPVLFHTSQALFSILILIHYIEKVYRDFNIYTPLKFCIIPASIALIVGVLGAFASSMLDLGVSDYGLERLSTMGDSTEGSMNNGFILMITIPMMSIILIRLLKYRDYLQPFEDKLYMIYFCMIAFSYFNPDNTMRYRFFNMSYGFMPFIVPLLFGNGGLFRFIYLSSIAILFPLLFFTTLSSQGFQYAPTIDVIIDNAISLISYRL